MPTQVYRNSAGETVPGNTTVIGGNLGWSKHGLMYWAWDQGRNGKDFRETRDEAATAGTLGHALIEADIKGHTFTLPPWTASEVKEKAESALLNYLEWKRQMNFDPVTMEVACVSEEHRFGTTIDIIGRVCGQLSIVEVKTSNDVHPDFLIQLSAQQVAWDETHNDKIESLHLLRLHKRSAAFSHHYWHALPEGFEAFLHLRALHDLKKKLKGLV